MLNTLNNSGTFYTYSKRKNEFDQQMQSCIEETVYNLSRNHTSIDRPGMLLGKIQSGKTRTFLGVMALAFDNQYDIVVILTKGTKALAQQTLERLKVEFKGMMDQDLIQIFDIMVFPNNLTKYELDQKLVFVVKKEIKNMARLHEAFFETYPKLAGKRILIIDDEADFASVGFEKRKEEEQLKIKKIAGKIDEFRQKAASSSFLQVTATPYSLYLQPEDIEIEGMVFRPIKPAFTVLVPIHDKYIGGDYYFQESVNEDSIAYHLFDEVDVNELQVLKKQDRRVFKIEDCLVSPKVQSLRNAIVNFLVGGCIRRIQGRTLGNIPKKFSFIIHTEQNKAAHEWQESIIFAIKDYLSEECKKDTSLFKQLIKKAYSNLKNSITLIDSLLPDLDVVLEEAKEALNRDFIMITKVNSEKDVNELLDESGQLKLRTPLNIFIGGQILDRGITIGNLIGFYYGRRPKTFQQDTVLQHSRMYGARPLEDLSVTRFYTTTDIYSVMKRMHEFDSALREAFEKGTNDNGVIFIQRDISNQIIPCSPNKILLANTTTLKPGTRLLPVGFELRPKTYTQKSLAAIDKIIDQYCIDKGNTPAPFLIDLSDATKIAWKISEAFEEGYSWDPNTFAASLDYLTSLTKDNSRKGKLWVIVRRNRDIARVKADGRLENSPDSYQEKGLARDIATDIPALILLRQNGTTAGWNGHPFYWPVLVAPKHMQTVVFANNLYTD
ncbi:MAG: Z1 domain-containing protein [Paenibacillus sp.]|uniref:Z1 domain-containing protein n=1 Tax=Paenibacillus sp. TaxID=58172 RepID=UPI0028FF46F7|nr:Z1 domain-containing protein [Paenibacillus sp.]MDU2241076.1 Z1 domain-containing protein [Paenibacillus sp.]